MKHGADLVTKILEALTIWQENAFQCWIPKECHLGNGTVTMDQPTTLPKIQNIDQSLAAQALDAFFHVMGWNVIPIANSIRLGIYGRDVGKV